MIAVLIVPIAVALLFVFNQIEQSQTERVSLSAMSDLKKTEIFSATNADIAATLIQTIKANPQISEFLSRSITAEELVKFTSQTTPYLESVAISNPYIRSIRIYCNSEYLPERWPIFISNERVMNEDWFKSSRTDNVASRINYGETLSSYSSQLSGERLISFSSAFNDENGKQKAVVEISYEMDSFFGELYTGEADKFCFLYRDGEVLLNSENYPQRAEIARAVAEAARFSETDDFVRQIGSTKYLISVLPDISLGGMLVMVNDLSSLVNQISRSRLVLLIIISVLIIVLAAIYGRITTAILKRIYETIKAMRMLEEGNTRVKIENPSKDEIGQLQRYFNQMLDKIDYLVDQNAKRSLLEKDAEIKALQNQINSHFLYNILNNIEMMAVIDENYLIADTVTALGRLLRYSMNWKSQMVALSDEIVYVQDYIQLFNIRFDNTIKFVSEISADVNCAFIPKMSVQPIVENAIVHGIENASRDAVIRISALSSGELLIIEITDSGSGISEENLAAINDTLQSGQSHGNLTGIGLKNVQERIELCFGTGCGYGLAVTSKVNEFTKVTLKMPIRGEMHEKYSDSRR